MKTQKKECFQVLWGLKVQNTEAAAASEAKNDILTWLIAKATEATLRQNL